MWLKVGKLGLKFWRDETGFLVSAELVLVATLLVLGLVVGLHAVARAVVGELNDLAGAIEALDQSYGYPGLVLSWVGWDGASGHCRAYGAGSWFVDGCEHSGGCVFTECDVVGCRAGTEVIGGRTVERFEETGSCSSSVQEPCVHERPNCPPCRGGERRGCERTQWPNGEHVSVPCPCRKPCRPCEQAGKAGKQGRKGVDLKPTPETEPLPQQQKPAPQSKTQRRRPVQKQAIDKPTSSRSPGVPRSVGAAAQRSNRSHPQPPQQHSQRRSPVSRSSSSRSSVSKHPRTGSSRSASKPNALTNSSSRSGSRPLSSNSSASESGSVDSESSVNQEEPQAQQLPPVPEANY